MSLRKFYASRKSYAKMTPAERVTRDIEDAALNAYIASQVKRIKPQSKEVFTVAASGWNAGQFEGDEYELAGYTEDGRAQYRFRADV